MKALALLVVALVGLQGCLLKPDRPTGAPSDGGSGDGAVPSFVPRLISTAYFAKDVKNSPGMTEMDWTIPTSGVLDGDLLLLLADSHTGGLAYWTTPSGFQQLVQQVAGPAYETTYYASWKIANQEPASYGASYGPGRTDGNSTIALIAIRDTATTAPLSSDDNGNMNVQSSPVMALAPSITTTVPGSLLLWAGGANWQTFGYNFSEAFTPPSGYTELVSFGDHGDTGFSDTTLSVAYTDQPNAGPTGAVTGEIAASNTGVSWGMLFAISPR